MHNHPSIAAQLAPLDFTNPTDLFLAFHFVRHWPNLVAFSDEAYERDHAIIASYAPLLFGRQDGPNTRDTVHDFLADLGGWDEQAELSGRCFYQAPREWMAVFREALDRDVIGPVAFGAACRFLVTGTSGNAHPGFDRDSHQARAGVLADARRSAPDGLMSPAELSTLAGLPETVSIYRGGRADFGLSVLDLAQNVHWTPNGQYAVRFMKGRGRQRSHHVIADTLRALPCIALPAALRSGTDMRTALGRPFLLHARVPKALVLGYFDGTVDDVPTAELLVDFERVDADAIQDVTPDEYRWAA